MLDVKVIGEGSFSRIIQVKVKNKIRVIKKLEYESIDDVIMLTPKTLRELVFLQYIDSKYVIKPTNITNTYLYMQNEGNNLYEYITGLKNSNSLLSWTEYKLIFWQIVRGIFDIHNKGIIHGDIKPQNILYSKKSNSVKICDFNFSTLDDGSISGKSYTLQYRPLESLLSTYNNKYDKCRNNSIKRTTAPTFFLLQYIIFNIMTIIPKQIWIFQKIYNYSPS